MTSPVNGLVTDIECPDSKGIKTDDAEADGCNDADIECPDSKGIKTSRRPERGR